MAFQARTMVSKKKPREEEHLVFDQNTDSYCLRLFGGSNEKWSDHEISKAESASVDSDCGVALIYIECFGGSCDHWARIYKCGQEEKRFEEHSDLREIMAEVGLLLPENRYYGPLDLREHPDLPRMPE